MRNALTIVCVFAGLTVALPSTAGERGGGRQTGANLADGSVSASPNTDRLTPRQRRMLHRNVRASAWWASTVWPVRAAHLVACADDEGGLNARRIVRGAAGEVGWWQFLPSTWEWMRGKAVKAARQERRSIPPRRYLVITSPLGQAWVVGWAFSHGYVHHWHGRGC